MKLGRSVLKFSVDFFVKLMFGLKTTEFLKMLRKSSTKMRLMKIFRRRKVQLEKRPKSSFFFVRTLKNGRAEELRSENGSFGTDFCQ